MLIARVVRNVLAELRLMSAALGSSARAADFVSIEESAVMLLTRIRKHIARGRIQPRASTGRQRRSDVLRMGVFPIAANPFHWAHLLAGLLVMERFTLDKVVYVIAGQDRRKPLMAPEAERHAMAREVLRLFWPLFEYSPIALGTDSCGEENLFKLISMAPFRHVHAFYVAGGDHYHRFRPATGVPDTIERIEQGIATGLHGFDPRKNRVSVVFLQRGAVEEEISTWLDVRWLHGPSIEASSTEIREALADAQRRAVLSTLPYAALLSICRHNLYHATVCDESPALIGT